MTTEDKDMQRVSSAFVLSHKEVYHLISLQPPALGWTAALLDLCRKTNLCPTLQVGKYCDHKHTRIIHQGTL